MHKNVFFADFLKNKTVTKVTDIANNGLDDICWVWTPGPWQFMGLIKL